MTLKVLFSYVFLGGLILVSLCLHFTQLDPTAINQQLVGLPTPPSLTHWFGTDELGRDMFIRCLFGAKVSLMVGFVSVGISIAIGIVVGMVAGFIGGIIDEVIMRIIDMLMALPTLFLILIIQVILEPSIYNVMIVIGVTSWMGVARLVRAEVLSLKERLFVTAAKARGIRHKIIVIKHIFPHTLNPVIVAAMLGMGGAILTESVLSFLGLGVQPPHASWGNMLESSLGYMRDAPWMALIPGILITLTVLALNFLGDSLWLMLDPKAKEKHAKRI